jgi:hypothetical protein
MGTFLRHCLVYVHARRAQEDRATRVVCEKVVVINQTAAKSLWPGRNALDKMLRVGGDDRRVSASLAT